MNPLLLSSMIFFVVLFSSCAPKAPQPVAPPAQPARLELSGYSFQQPDEPGWSVLDRNDQQVLLSRKGAGEEVYNITAMLLQLPAFGSVQDMTAWVRQAQQRDAGSLPFVIDKHNVWPVDVSGGDCVRSMMTATDRQAGADGVALVTEVHGITCPHPTDLQIGVYLIYSERYRLGQEDKLLHQKAETLFRSLQFRPF